MYKTEDIKNLLLQELIDGNIKDCGYDCQSGRRYVEVKNALFEVDKDRIFENIPKLSYMDDSWYVVNYEPLLERNNQYDKCINKLVENPASRQAVLILVDPKEYDNEDKTFICTMYIHIFLNHIEENTYELEYIVHMRSNDAIEFITDHQWHQKIYFRIFNELIKKTNYIIIKKPIVWNADTIHLYEQFWKQAIENY